MYECQTTSKKWRFIENVFGSYYKTDKLYEELYSKHFKKFYAGKPTKRYLKILRQLQKVERLSSSDIEEQFLH